jgi:Ca2+-binding RTX toxin-like protein
VLKYGVSDQLTVTDYFYISVPLKIEQFQFSDGVTWNIADLLARVNTIGTDSADSINGYTAGSNRIYGLGGNDALTGYERDDLLDGGTGNDTLIGGDGNDNLLGGDGNDSLTGGIGNDTLIGGIGSDTMIGSQGSDTYILALGAGNDTINDSDVSTTDVDIVKFTDVPSTAVTSLDRKGNDLVIKYGDADQLTATNYFNPSYPGMRIEQFQFSDGVIWDASVILARVKTEGTDGADNVSGYTGGGNRIWGLGGNDTLTGRERDDLLDGGAGNDTLTGNDGNDTLLGGDGNDSLDGGAGNDTLTGGAGSDVIGGGCPYVLRQAVARGAGQ